MSCCYFSDFMDDFNHYWSKYFTLPPSQTQLKRAKKDWNQGSTGWEAVQIAKEFIAIDEQKANEKPLVCIGGRNFAHADSEFAIKYAKKSNGIGYGSGDGHGSGDGKDE